MIYQVVSSHRTGSSLLHQYSLNDNDNFGFHELFLNQYSFLHANSIEEKFELLEYYKNKDIHFAIKVFPFKLISEGYEERIFDYLNGYKILTINRDAWSAFLSHSYQKYTNWKFSHRSENGKFDFVELNSYEIDLDAIPHFCEKWKIDFNFINKLNVNKTFDYKDLTIEKLQDFFHTKYSPYTRPSSIVYRDIAINYEEAKELFHDKMFSVDKG